ncbi:GOLPH3/VPS74 family protein [Leifsonia sp. 2MCAF36]|uniref:GOLPH3/VPS74 family protein n=1 Tax=Leifsonia sp. 2MCAF36 TaxID=3232988 RepID=UPI003F993CD1
MAHLSLTVPEGLALLLLRDSDGRRAVPLRTFQAVLAAGLLAELAAREEITLDAEGRVRAQPLAGPAGPLLLKTRTLIAATAVPRTDEWWIDRLACGPVTDAVIAGLVERGVLGERNRTFFGFAASPVHPARSCAEEDSLRDAVRWSLAVDHHPSPRVAATVALLDVVGRLRDVAGFIPDTGLDLRSGQWPAAALQAWLLGDDPVAGRALRTSIERGAPA